MNGVKKYLYNLFVTHIWSTLGFAGLGIWAGWHNISGWPFFSLLIIAAYIGSAASHETRECVYREFDDAQLENFVSNHYEKIMEMIEREEKKCD
jgi:hypothetical protein